jgi:hypothetical protein
MRLSRLLGIFAVATITLSIACSSNTSSGGNGGSSGGNTAKGGTGGSGGNTGSGGVSNTAGKSGPGGANAGGGATSSGGLTGSGGASNTAGKSGSGGASAGGGPTSSGGLAGSGGASNTAEKSGSGGANTDGGASGSGGKMGSDGILGTIDGSAGEQCGPSTVVEPFSTSIAGTWDFTPAGGAKRTLQVPGGGWAKQGVNAASGTYATQITVPDSGAAQTTLIEFGAVNFQATLSVDGKEVATNMLRSFLRFSTSPRSCPLASSMRSRCSSRAVRR